MYVCIYIYTHTCVYNIHLKQIYIYIYIHVSFPQQDIYIYIYTHTHIVINWSAQLSTWQSTIGIGPDGSRFRWACLDCFIVAGASQFPS